MKQYYLWLILAFGAGNPIINGLLEKFGSPKAVYEAIRGNCAAIGAENLRLAESTDLSEAKELIGTLSQRGIELITISDKRYPPRLRNIENPPCLLFAAGNTRLLGEKLVTTAGSRAVTHYTLAAQDKICRELSDDYVFVSTLSEGCDAMTCLCAVKNGKGCVEVLPCGFDYEYPRYSRTLRFQLLAQGGCVITEYPPSVKPIPANFSRRSRILGGISGALIIFQAGTDSGALLAANYSPAVFFLPPHNVFAKEYAGAAASVRAGARMYCGKSDIDAAFSADFSPMELHLQRKKREKPAGKPKPMSKKTEKQPENPPLTRDDFETELQFAVYTKLSQSDEPTHYDVIFSGLDCSIAELSEALLDLEIDGKLRVYPGNRYGLI